MKGEIGTVHGWRSWELPVAEVAGDTHGQWSMLIRLQDEGASATATFYSRDAAVYPNHLPQVPDPYLSLTTAPVPEPASWARLVAGLGMLRLARCKGRQPQAVTA